MENHRAARYNINPIWEEVWRLGWVIGDSLKTHGGLFDPTWMGISAPNMKVARAVLEARAGLDRDQGKAMVALSVVRGWADATGHCEFDIVSHLIASRLALVTQQAQHAVREAEQALSKAKSAGLGLLEVDAHIDLGRAALRAGDIRAALRHGRAARELAAAKDCGYGPGPHQANALINAIEATA
jgi:hypothetical protein